MNAIRLRVWVNPASNYNSTTDVLAKAKRVKAAGMKLMVDFHYSDNWADPGKQIKPAAWASYNIDQLNNALRDHTRDSLILLRDAGITPDWVRVGNETNDGFLWNDGRASTNMKNYAGLAATGYDAVK
jgi:arabinogalactan endo-1,4-beta-galactosidase